MVDKNLIRIDVLNHADFCGEFRGDARIPGLRKFFQAVESVRRCNPQGTLLLDAGDEINRLLWHGNDVLDGMALLKTDAWTLGNHEFDRGQQHLQDCLSYLNHRIPVLCGNITCKETGTLIPQVRPYVILQRKGIKIGIVGVTTEYTEKMVTYPMFEPFEMHSASEVIHRYVPEMRKNGAEIIIVLAHIGAYSTDGQCSGELFDLLQQIKDLPVDLLIGGHLNGNISWPVDGIMVNKGGFSGKSLIHTALYFDTESRKVVCSQGRVLYPLEEQYDIPNINIDSFVDKVLAPYDEYFNTVLAEAQEDLPMNYNGESAMGNLLADAARSCTGTDFSYFNTTSCGPLIPKGKVTPYTIKQACYFDEPLMVSIIKGAEIRQLFETVLDPAIYSKNFNLFFSGVKVTVDYGKPCGQRVMALTYPDGRAVTDDDVLTVCTSEYMASGGNDTRNIAKTREWKNSGVMVHETIRKHLQDVQVLENRIDNRYVMLGSIPRYDSH
ncbi:MAG: 5'-nucleotidase C-terminal domain-containing protein [Erysipelotrichaceae bacterium]|nr:5'-nucleotidase C-terminal domain-containing protein [Erysipelotrichaceae bacterium]